MANPAPAPAVVLVDLTAPDEQQGGDGVGGTISRAVLDIENWWYRNNDQVGAGRLAARCVAEYGWELDYATRALRGYRQFLEMKKAFQDWNATHIHPSNAVDAVWKLHILDVTNYSDDCLLLCGHLVARAVHFGEDTDQAAMNATEQRMIQNTRTALTARFGHNGFDRQIWSWEEPTTRAGTRTPAERPPQRRRLNPSSNQEPSDAQEAARRLALVPLTGDEAESAWRPLRVLIAANEEALDVRVQPLWSVATLKSLIRDQTGIAVERQRLIFNGHSLADDQRLNVLQGQASLHLAPLWNSTTAT